MPLAKNLTKKEKRIRLIKSFFPFIDWVKTLTPKTIKIDFFAAITSAIFALPQGIAFALIAGLPPEFGLYAAIVAPIAGAFFGSSWHNVSGPTVATSIVIIGILSEFAVPQSPQYIGFVLILTLIAGLIQLTLGILRLGHIVTFISQTVILGFSCGAAFLIILNQATSFLGINIEKQSNVLLHIKAIYLNIGSANIYILTLSCITFLSAVIVAKYFRKLPYLLIAMGIGSTVAFIMTDIFDIKDIGMVGALPRGLPPISIPNISLYQVQELFSAALAISILGLIQAVSISKTIASKSGQRVDSSQEFIGQGMSNIACSFFTGFFSSSSFTRTGVSYSAGSKTPLASIFASGIIILVLLFASDSTSFLPKSAMSAIIVLVGWKLINFSQIKKAYKTSKSEFIIFLVTFLSTLFLSLQFAIYSGVLLSLIFYLQKTSHPKIVDLTIDKYDPYRRLIELTSERQKECPQLNILRIDGSLFFGATDHVTQKILEYTDKRQTHILLICNGVNLIDYSGAEMLLKIKQALNAKEGDLFLSGLKAEPRSFLVNSPYWHELGATKNIYNSSVIAINDIFNQLDHDKCRYCDKRVFVECDQVDYIKTGQKVINL